MALLRESTDYAILMMALAQSTTFPRTVLFGDSRARPVHLKGAMKVCFGGAGIRDFDWLIPTVRRIARPRKVVVALGLNDARSPSQEPHVIAGRLPVLLGNTPEVVVCEPWPLEPAKQYSSRYDTAYLKRLREELRKVSADHGWGFVPAPEACATYDGAHFEGDTLKAYGEMLYQATVTNGMSLMASH